MRSLVDQQPVPDGTDFIDTVGKLKAAVLDMHLRRAMRNVAAIDIGNAGHGLPPPRRSRGGQRTAFPSS